MLFELPAGNAGEHVANRAEDRHHTLCRDTTTTEEHAQNDHRGERDEDQGEHGQDDQQRGGIHRTEELRQQVHHVDLH